MSALAKRIAILGSTGSIGCSALEVVEHLGSDLEVTVLTARRQADALLEQCRRFRPKLAVLTEAACANRAGEFAALGVELRCGAEALREAVLREDVDLVLASIVGAAGLPAVLATVEAGKTLALANKEALVVAGGLLMPLARRSGATILPVDSEHSAIFQAMAAGRREEVRRVYLTASGGPFRTAPLAQMRSATPADALNHPTWRMGSKISIDSATMFNKALELIEACWLFDLDPDDVEVVIHPESVVHSMVEFVDGSVLAQLSPPDMRTPIQYALTWPQRKVGIGRRVDFTRATHWRFEPPDLERFPALELGYRAARLGGSAGAVLNAANEEAVEAFLNGQIAFGEVSDFVAAALDQHTLMGAASLDDLLRADGWARGALRAMCAARAAV